MTREEAEKLYAELDAHEAAARAMLAALQAMVERWERGHGIVEDDDATLALGRAAIAAAKAAGIGEDT